MITSRRHVTKSHEAPYRLASRLPLKIGAVALGLVSAIPSTVAAQSTTTLSPDAATLPRGVLRARVLTAWNRADVLFGVPGADGTTKLTYGLNADSLGTAAIPLLQPNESSIRAVSNVSAFRLNLGKLVTGGDSRVVTSPLIIEYGLSSRLTLGVTVPLVQTRTTLITTLNQQRGLANVGPNPGLLDASAASLNRVLVGQFGSAASALNSRLASCQANPALPECATIVGHEADARALIQSSSTFASALAALYGIGADQPGQPFVPLTGTPIQLAINGRIASFDTAYRTYLGANQISGTVAPAQGPAALAQFQDILIAAGHDTVGSTDRISIGDISLGAVLQLINTYGDSTKAQRLRLSVHGTFRIPTGQTNLHNAFYDIGTGYGQPGVEGGVAADIAFAPHWTATALGSYTYQLGTVAVARAANPLDTPFPLVEAAAAEYSAGDVFWATVIPRLRLAHFFSLNGRYSLIRVGADRYSNVTVPIAGVPGLTSSTQQRVGFGFQYSTITEPDRAPGGLPIEVGWTHEETLTGSGGPVAKTFRDQIELRMYFGRRR
jgi:hypothetical protein